MPNDLRQQEACQACAEIPKRLQVEMLHGEERLPEAVKNLEVIGGNPADDELGQVRRCLTCGAFFLWFRDHESEAGVGKGYTYEGIQRVTDEWVRQVVKKNLRSLETSLEILEREAADENEKEPVRALARRRIERLREEKSRLSGIQKQL